MNKEEIFRHLKVGAGKIIKVDREVLNEYKGIYREITIFSDIEIRIDYLDKNTIELGEGEISFYFCYEDYESLFDSVEKLIGKGMEEWVNYNTKDYEPILGDYDLRESWEMLKLDFVNNQLQFPTGYREMIINSMYWEALYYRELDINAGIDEIEQWIRRKTEEGYED